MHCLGATAGATGQVASAPSVGAAVGGNNGGGGGGGSSASNATGNRNSALGVVRALGVLVCEGRIQGPPRGYKEGPHCMAPMQSRPNDHDCDKDNYLCDRYLVLVREIADRVDIGSYLCVEVVMCSDCPCGLYKSKSKHRLLSVQPPTSWQHNSEMLLEYWSVSVVVSKSPEMMNSQGLYQAVRSRLHFSQVAAWWSRTNGAKPNYIATRIVQPSIGDEHLRRFRETPIEHTFPLAGLGDGNSIKVTVWALPRMEDIPTLHCPMHPDNESTTTSAISSAAVVDGCTRASTPTKLLISTGLAGGSPSTSPSGPAVLDGLADGLVMPGKFTSNPSSTTAPSYHHPKSSNKAAAAAAAAAAQRQQSSFVYFMSSFRSAALLDDRLHIACDKPGKHHCSCADDEDDCVDEVTASAVLPLRPNGERKRRRSLPCRPVEPAVPPLSSSPADNSPASLPALKETSNVDVGGSSSSSSPRENNVDSLERNFRTQLSIEEQQECGNKEKRYKRSETVTTATAKRQLQESLESNNNTHVPFVIPWVSYNANGNAVTGSLPVSSPKDRVNLVVNPFCSDRAALARARHAELQQQLSEDWKKEKESSEAGTKAEQEGLLDWITRVPGRALGSECASEQTGAAPTTTTTPVNVRNCNLELSPREFDEVLAVLRTRTPMGRRRTALRTAKRREKYERLVNEAQSCPAAGKSTQGEKSLGSASNKADVLLGAILRSSSKESSARKGLADISNGARSQLPTKDDACTSQKNQVVAAPDAQEEAALSSGLNKRLYRIRQLFKRDQDKIRIYENNAYPHQQQVNLHSESRAKRRINFSTSENGDEDGEADDEGGESDETRHDSSTGTSTNDSAHVKSIFLSTNENGDSSCSCGEEQELQHQNETCSEKSTMRKKTRGKRDLSPIWVNHNNNNVEKCIEQEEKVVKGEATDAETIDRTVVPSAKDQERFRRSLENAASMVFHSRTGLPLTSSPAPLRRGSCCFDFDSSLNSVSSKRSALFELNTPPSPGAVSLEEGDRETENICDIEEVTRRRSNSRHRPQSHALLGSFEESALNGRLEPVSTVHGFTAEIGASGSFCPKHRKLPVTVFFYTLGDNDKVSSPYLAHINLGKKGYQVPRSGTIQVTLLNPLGTVVKMFVVLYDLSDMPPRSHTFLRQRTLRDKTLRYLVHLRFMSGKSGRIYLHTDVRMIICRKSDVDTASDFGSEPPKELRSYIHGPTNPKFSPRC